MISEPSLLPKACRTSRRVALALSALLAAGCTHTTNLLNPVSPGFFGSYAAAAESAGPRDVRIVTFNIKLGRSIDRSIRVLENDSLAGADIIALQEMDELGVERIARTLKLNYAYYPGSIHPTDDRYFGPALLTPWPIERSWKVLLPHEGRIRHQRRTATAAILRIGDRRVLAYAVHLETQLKISESGRRDQVQTMLDDAAGFAGPVVIAGDFNSEGIGPYLVRNGYHWATDRLGPSITIFSWDHIFARGLQPKRSGVVRGVQGASDHRPVWAVAAADSTLPRTTEYSSRTRDGGMKAGSGGGGSGTSGKGHRVRDWSAAQLPATTGAVEGVRLGSRAAHAAP